MLGDHDTVYMMEGTYEWAPVTGNGLPIEVKTLSRLQRLFTLRHIRSLDDSSQSPNLAKMYKSLLLPKKRPYRVQRGKSDWLRSSDF